MLSIVNSVLGIFDPLQSVFLFGSIFRTIIGFIEGIISLIILIFVIIALVKVSKGQDASLPGLSSLAERAFGIIAQKVYTAAPPAGGQPQQPYQAPYQAPNGQPQQPYQAPYQAPSGQPQQPNQPGNQNPQQ